MLKRSSRILLQWMIAGSVLGASTIPAWAQLNPSLIAGGRIAPSPDAPDSRFLERYALAADRESLLQELIPGSEPYFYFNTLHYQNVGDLKESNRYLELWKGALVDSPNLQAMHLRQNLLSYPENPAGVRRFLQQQYGLQLDASAPQQDEAASLANSLEPDWVDYPARLRTAFDQSRFGQLEPATIEVVGGWLQDDNDVIHWLSRVQRVDAPGLLDVIERELQRPLSQGFGWAPNHNLLTLSQLEQLEKRVPGLLELCQRSPPKDSAQRIRIDLFG